MTRCFLVQQVLVIEVQWLGVLDSQRLLVLAVCQNIGHLNAHA